MPEERMTLPGARLYSDIQKTPRRIERYHGVPREQAGGVWFGSGGGRVSSRTPAASHVGTHITALLQRKYTAIRSAKGCAKGTVRKYAGRVGTWCHLLVTLLLHPSY